jgi:hypothetical protein
LLANSGCGALEGNRSMLRHHQGISTSLEVNFSLSRNHEVVQSFTASTTSEFLATTPLFDLYLQETAHSTDNDNGIVFWSKNLQEKARKRRLQRTTNTKSSMHCRNRGARPERESFRSKQTRQRRMHIYQSSRTNHRTAQSERMTRETSSRPRVVSSSRELLMTYKLAARAEKFWHERRKIPSQNSLNNLRENNERHTEEA